MKGFFPNNSYKPLRRRHAVFLRKGGQFLIRKGICAAAWQGICGKARKLGVHVGRGHLGGIKLAVCYAFIPLHDAGEDIQRGYGFCAAPFAARHRGQS